MFLKGVISRKKRICGIMMAVIFLCSCGNQTGSEVFEKSQSRPVITIMAPLHFPQGPDSSLVQRLEEMTGTTLMIDWVPDEIYTDKMNAKTNDEFTQESDVCQIYGLHISKERDSLRYVLGGWAILGRIC